MGGYDPDYLYAEDYDLWLRLADRHGSSTLDEPLAIRSLDGRNVSTVRERACISASIHMRLRAMRRRRSVRGWPSLLRSAISYALPTRLKHARRRWRGQGV